MAQELKAYNVVATVDVNPEVVDSLGCTEYAAYDADEVDAVLKEKDEYIEQLRGEVAKWHKAYDALLVERNGMAHELYELKTGGHDGV